MKQYHTIALIVAAGNGERFYKNARNQFAGLTPKQYLPLSGKTILRHSVTAFLNHPKIDAVCVVYNPEFKELYDKTVADLPLLPPVTGGKTRQESVQSGLENIKKYAPQKVLIHDSARPLIDSRIISDIVDALDYCSGAIPAIAVDDTIKNVAKDQIKGTLPRDNLMRAQTPQGFIFSEILEANKILSSPPPPIARGGFTDDASIFEHLGKPVAIVAGSQNNFKITNYEDLERAEIIMGNNFETRIGMGFDAHKFCPPKQPNNNYIMLCGIPIPHELSLDGHSDADAPLHALVDAILGAIAQGDIGTHFPPGDEKWRGADSSIFLAHAANLIRERNAQINNLDITIICERPKILPHREKMCVHLAKILGIENSRVSVKATTTEGMGFTGRSEGIAAQAVVSVRVMSAR
jgi:2-C-methyl-D-erythritol 4-phosphate cytidylyltransferase/2-C-methyl-D-erythritol 2,4-cyclodiphosphate synthase